MANTKVRIEQGGDRGAVGSGGSFDVESGGEIDIESGGSFKVGGSAISSTEFGFIDGVTAGTAAASKAVVLGSSKEIATITTATITTLNSTNIDAGASGTAGTVDVFPATASKGKLIVSCDDQTGNTNVTLKPNAMGQATTVNIPDPGAAASYVVQSTAALTLAEADVLDNVTAGTVAASKAVVVDSNKDIGDFRNLDCVNLDAGASGAAGSVDVFPTTASRGKLAITCTDQTGDTTVSLVAGAMAAARTITIPDPGAAASVVMSTNATTAIASNSLELDTRAVYLTLDDISTASSAFKVCPYTGNVIKIYSVIDGAIASGDAALTTSIAGVAITDGGWTIANAGSAAGDVDEATPSAANAVTAGQALSVTTDGGSTNTVKGEITFVIQIT